MDADQRLVALKRAYADVIMNISKEAAARVMVSERKSQLLENELRVTKDEAVQTMLRLKMLMDDKIREAKNTSQNQQEKIDELEAQLQEAEDIVSELRKEKFSLIASDKENSYLNQRTEYPKCPSQLIQMKNSYDTKPELPSIIRRSKKHMFYRNGFSQRIHACERNVLDGELSLSRQPNSVSNKGKEGEQKEKSTCNATIDGVDMMFNIGNKGAMHKDDSASCWYDVQAMNLIPGKAGIPTQPEFAKTTEMNEDSDKGDIGKMIHKGESPVDMSVPTVQEEGASTKNLAVLVSKPNLKKINEPAQYCELKPTDATSEGPSLPVAKRVIKYTFQRRRKRGTVSIAKGNVSAKNNTSLRKQARQNDSAELEKSSLVSESSLSLYLYGR